MAGHFSKTAAFELITMLINGFISERNCIRAWHGKTGTRDLTLSFIALGS